MRRSLLNKRILPKPLRQALVLFTLLLLPSAAWGGNYNSGTLDTNNNTWGVWKLSDAAYSSPQYDYLSFSGAGTITLTLTRPDNTLELIKSIRLEIGGTETSSTTTLKSAMIGTTDITSDFVITDNSSLTYTFQPTVPIEWSGDIVITLQGTNNSGSILGAYVQTVTGYGLSVAGVPVTDDNKTNILGDQNSTVSFTPAGQDTPATLTLKDATINGGIVWSQTSDLVIDLTRANTIDAITTAENLSEKPNLSFTGSGSLEIANESGYAITEFNTVSLANGLYLKSDNPGAYWDEDRNTFVANSSALSSLTITSDVYYPIWVISSDGVSYTQVSGTNKENVFNDDTPKVSYDSDNNQLTLNYWECATTGGEFAIILGDQESFNIQLWGVNKIGGSGISFAKEDASLALSTDDEHQGSLTIVQNQSNNYYFTSIPDDNITYSKLTRTDNAVTYQASLITVAGVSPDSEGKFSGISGVTFKPATIGVDQSSSTPATLTLDGATINGRIEWKNGTNNLRLCLSGKNSIISNKGGEPPVSVFKAENTCTLFVEKVSDAESATLKYASYGTTDGTPSNVTSYFENFILSANTAFNQTAFVIQDGDIKYNYLTTTGTDNLSVAGIQVHGISGELGYRNNILQDEDATVKFDGSQTLTLNNAEIYSFSSTHAIETGLSTLNIDLKGNNSITTEGGYALYGATSSGSYTIIFTSSSDPVGNLTLKRSSGTLANYVTIDYDTNTGLVPTIITPSDASDLAAAKEAIIAKGTAMGITVAGVVVTNSNYTDIKGDGITGTKVSFTPANEGNETPAILTLNNASITGNVKFNDDLTVHLVGDNTITKPEDASGFYAFDLAASYNDLNLSTDETNPGTLKFVGLGSDSQAGSQRDYIIYSTYGHKNFTSDTTGDPTWKETYSTDATPSYFILSLNKHYNLWKNGHQYHDLILDNNDGFVFDPDPENPTLTITNSSSSDYINSGLEDLTIIVSGSQSLSHIAFGAPADTQAEGITTGTLTIKKNETSTATVNELTLANADGGVISGFSSVTIEEPMGVKSPSPFTTWEGTHNAVISDEVLYDLWVGGVQVTSGNASDILGVAQSSQSSQPTAVFNAETSTLTLNGATIEATEGSGIESELSELNVNIVGINRISAGGSTDDAAFKGTGTNAIAFTFDSSSSSLFIESINPISGLKATFENGYGLTSVSPGAHYLEQLVSPYFSSASSENGITVTLNKPQSNTDEESKYKDATIYYSITYANEADNVEDAEYTTSFSMTKPGTVTAYLTLEEERGQSEDVIGKYYGYPDAPYTIGAGNDVSPDIYPNIVDGEYIGFYDGGYSSNNETIATFAAGKITAKEPGTTTLTATLSGSDMAFTVLNPYDPTNSSHYPITFSVIVGENLDNLFAANQNFGTWYNTSDKTYKVPDGITAYIITGVDGDKVTIAETKVIPPNAPILMEKGENAKAFTYTEATDTDGSFPSGNILNYTTTDKEAVEASKLYVLYNGQFVKVTAGTKILANHCYLDLGGTSAGTRGFYNIGDGEGTTAIREVIYEGVNSEKLADGAWHDLQGRKFTTKPTKAGIYIRNGKKIVIK